MTMRGDDHTPGYDLGDLVEFANDPELRCACVLLLDTSKSMSIPVAPAEALGEKMDIVDGVQTYAMSGTHELLIPMKELSEGIKTFKNTLESDSLASTRVETAIVTFDSDVRVLQDFATVDSRRRLISMLVPSPLGIGTSIRNGLISGASYIEGVAEYDRTQVQS